MQQFLIIILTVPMFASGSSGGMSLDELLSEGNHVHSSLKADSDAVRARIKLQLAELAKNHDEHLAAHKHAQTKLETHLKAEGHAEVDDSHQHVLGELQNLHEKDHVALKTKNDDSREKVKQELAKLEAMRATHEVFDEETHSLHKAHETNLARLDAKHEVFESHAAHLKAKDAHEEARARAQEQLAKLQELHNKAASAPKSMRGTTAKHILQKDPAFIKAMAQDTTADAGASVHLAQTGASFLGKKRNHGGGGGDLTFPLFAVIGAFAVAYCTVNQAPMAGGSVAHNPFEGQRPPRSKAD